MPTQKPRVPGYKFITDSCVYCSDFGFIKKKKKIFVVKLRVKKKNYHPWIFLTALALIIPIVKKIKTYTSRSRPLDSSAEALIFNISNFSPRRTLSNRRSFDFLSDTHSNDNSIFSKDSFSSKPGTSGIKENTWLNMLDIFKRV